jgi:hypothetical protein
MQLRWLVLYYGLLPDSNIRTERAKVIVDHAMSFPYGVQNEQIAGDCMSIIAIVPLPDDYEPDAVVFGNAGVERPVDVELPVDDGEGEA